ncbi:MAG TPA: hypothetical protein VH107_17330 [Lacipirellulaceae bacterium]|nr:hypothetical protein [Lacipirellulaceae bacterium]
MAKSETTVDAQPRRSIFALPRFRFSLAWMLICVTLIAVALGLSIAIGSLVTTLLFAIVYCVLPTPLVIFAIFARGDSQAFAIGALIPWWTLQTWMPGASSFSNAIWLLVMCTACGVVAGITRRWIRFTGSGS